MFFRYGLKENFRPVMRNEKVFRQFEIKISTRICLENTLRAEVSRSRFSVYEVVRVASLLRSWFVYAL